MNTVEGRVCVIDNDRTTTQQVTTVLSISTIYGNDINDNNYDNGARQHHVGIQSSISMIITEVLTLYFDPMSLTALVIADIDITTRLLIVVIIIISEQAWKNTV
jgi:hypothetical protein